LRGFTIFVAFLWTHFNSLMSFLYWSAQNCTLYSKWGCTNAVQSGTITCLAMLCLMHSRTRLALLAARARCWLVLNLPSTQPPPKVKEFISRFP